MADEEKNPFDPTLMPTADRVVIRKLLDMKAIEAKVREIRPDLGAGAVAALMSNYENRALHFFNWIVLTATA